MKNKSIMSKITRIGSIVLSILLFQIFISGIAQADTTIGIVDLEKVKEEHPLFKQWEKDLKQMKAKKEQELKEAIMQEFGFSDINEIETTSLTEDQTKKLQQMYMAKEQELNQELEPRFAKRMAELRDDVVQALQAVAKEKSIDIVMDSSVVLIGGIDMTGDIINHVSRNYLEAPEQPADHD